MFDSASRPFRLPRTVLLLGVTSFFTDVGSEMIFPLLPILFADFVGGVAVLGVIEGAADALSSVLKLYSGRIADRLPRRKPLVLTGYGLSTLVRPLMAVAASPWHALVIRLVDRTGKGIRSSPRDALIADAAEPGAAGRAFGFHRAMDHAGAVMGPLAATALLAAGCGVRSIFWIAILPGLLAVAALSLVREAPRAHTEPTHTTAPSTAPLPRTLKTYLGVLGLFALGNSSDVFLLMRARDLHISPAAIPALWALLHVSKVAWSTVGGLWSDRMPRVHLIVVGWIVYAATYFGFAIADQPWQGWALFILYGAFYGLSEPAEKALVKDLAPDDARGSAYGAYNFIVGVAALPAGLLMGALWSWGGHQLALTVGALVGLGAALLLAAWQMNRTSPP
jgi:MFS family permease